MRCTAYCTASSYSINRLLFFLRESYYPTLYRDVLHISVETSDKKRGDIFFFPYGVTIFYGLTEEEEHRYLLDLKNFEEDPLPIREYDELSYVYGALFKIHQDEITLPDDHVITKLAVAYGIAQSVKLTVFENSIKETIDKTRPLPENLVHKGKISLSRKEISRTIGELFIKRNSINLHSDILDTPEFFWEYPELDPMYRSTVNYLDVFTRVDVLNKRLNIVNELLEMLGNQLNHQHSSTLEWIIIALIVIEVIIALSKEVFHVL
jgi:uncharacterized Rmd1/YagE family protein